MTKFDVNVMRPALIEAHYACNKHAIKKSEAEDAGVVERMFDKWKESITKLQSTITPYIKAKMEVPIDEVKCQEAREKIFPAWEKILEVGEENPETPELEATEQDVDSLVGFAETYIGSAKGTLWSVQTDQKFRKDVEAFLGCKIIINVVLDHAERDLVRNYERSLVTIVTKQKELDGYDDKEGHKNGLRDDVRLKKDDIAGLQNTIQKIESLKGSATGDALEFFEGQTDFANKRIEALEAEIKDLDGAIKDAEKELKKARTFEEENKEAYDELMGRLN